MKKYWNERFEMSFMDDENDNNNMPSDEISMEDFFKQQGDGRKQDKVEIYKKEEKKVFIEKPDNNSGMDEDAPESIAKPFNWGAFLFNWVWGIRYKKWILLLVLAFTFIVPPYGLIVCLALSLWAGIKGNKWAWAEVQYKNEEDFHKSQKSWVKAWFVLFGVAVVISAIAAIVISTKPVEPREGNAEVSKDMNPIENISFFSSSELKIPEVDIDNTDSTDNHAQMLSSDKNIIYWIREENELTLANKEYIEKAFENDKDTLGASFTLIPDLRKPQTQDDAAPKKDSDSITLEAKCVNGDSCIDTWLYSNCNKGYCIINPKTKRYYKVRSKEGVIKKAQILQRKWSEK